MENRTIRIGTYNVGDFSGDQVPAGSEKARELFREVIEAEGVAFWALQEDVEFFNEENQELPYDAIYNSYRNYRRCGRHKYNFKAFLTDLPLGEAEQVYYTGSADFGHPWFLHTQLVIDGKEVCVICLHFDWADRNKRAAQIEQVIAFASKYDYAMIIGDFNPDDYIDYVKQSDNLTYASDLDVFRRAGYHAANADRFGLFTTYVGAAYEHPCDNIVVSGNIRIHNAGRIFRDWMNDHAAFWADVELC